MGEGTALKLLEPIFRAYKGKIPGGKEGDRLMRQMAKTRILEDNTLDDVLKPYLSVEEMNDLFEYIKWLMWDMVALRSLEGESGLIPRQEYESLSFIQEFYRFPQLFEVITQKVGPEGLIEMGKRGRVEIGTKIDMVHNFCSGLCPLFGRGLLTKMGWIKPWEYVEEVNTLLQFMRRVCFGYRGDGSIFSSQRGHTNCILERHWIDRFLRDMQPLDRGNNRDIFNKFNASTELLAFLSHFDCRLGMNDSGPYDLGNGHLMIVRNHFLWEEMYHWSDVCEELPYAVTLAFIIDSKKMGLKEIRVMNGATTFTKPGNYLPYITDACFYFRKQWDTQVNEIEYLPINEAGSLTQKVIEVTFKLYKKIAKMSRRQLITNGVYVYYIDMILPYARLSGLYDTLCKDYDLWEISKEASQAYYVLLENDYAKEILPDIMTSGEGFPLIPEQSKRA